MAERVTKAEVIRAALESHAMDFRVAMPGRVEKYDAAKQRADVKIELQSYVADGEGGHVAETLPVLPNVPVAFPQGGGHFLAFPLQKGDPVLVVFCDLPIGAWLKKGGLSEPGLVDPHGLGGAVCYPGITPNDDAIGDASDSTMVLGKDGTPAAQIECTASGLNLGTGTTDSVVTKKDLQFLFNCINGAIVTPQDGGAALKANILAALAIGGWSSDAGDGQLGSATTKAKR